MKFHLRTPSGAPIAPVMDDNVDILIEIDDGRLFAATVFTMQNLQSVMRSYRESGECASGTYIWAKNMIVVESISQNILERAACNLILSGEINDCCMRI